MTTIKHVKIPILIENGWDGYFMQKIWETYKKEIKFGCVVFLIFICFRYFFVYISPFIIAWLLCRIIYPCADFLHNRLHIPIMVSGPVFLLLIAAVPGVILYYGLCGMSKSIVPFCQNVKYFLVILEERLCDCCCILEQKFQIQEGVIVNNIKTGWMTLRQGVSDKWVPSVLQNSVGYIRVIASAGAYLLVIFVATLLLLKEWNHYKTILHEKVQKIGGDLFSFLGIYVWAEARIMATVGFICFLGLFAANVKDAFGLAALTAFLDMLPFIGTGIILLPLLIWQVLNQKYRIALVIAITYALCVLARELLEPKLIGEKAGVSPLLTLAGIYMGVHVFGLAGIILGPVYVLIVTLIYRHMFCNS